MASVEDLNYAAPAKGTARIRTRQSTAWRHWIGLVTALTDALTVMATTLCASAAYHGLLLGQWHNMAVALELAVMLTGLFVFTNLLRGRYRIDNYLTATGQIGAAFSAWNIAMFAFIAIVFMAKIVDHYSRAVVLLTYLAGIPLVAITRSSIARAINLASRSGRITRERIVLIGREADVMSFVARHEPWNIGFSIIDIAFLRRTSDSAALAADLAAAVARCRTMQPDAIHIAMPWSDQETIDACVDAFMNLPVAIHLTPERVMDRFDSPHIVRTGTFSSLRLTRPAMTALESAAKRGFDVIGAILILIMTLPLLLLIAALIRLDSAGPVLFLQRRHGFNQRTFRIFKFRTMTTTEDGDVIRQATRNDRRITRIGRVLRRYNLDELPQLLNVIAGQMSLVGPRPHALAHDHEFQRKIALYARRHNVKPGITGWAQVNGLRGETDTDEKMAKRVAFDHWYIDNWSFWLDMTILLRTVFSKKAFANAA